jgi:predicted transcriptional regulator
VELKFIGFPDEPTLSSINTVTIPKPSHSSYLPAYEDGTECSETSAYKIQTQGITQKETYNSYNMAKI